MVSPVFRQLKEAFPDAEIIFLTLKANKKLASAYNAIDRVIDIDISNPILLPARILNTVNTLRKEKIDLVIDFEQYSRTSAIISFLSNRKFGIGFDLEKNPRQLLFDETIPCNDSEHIVIEFEKILAKVGLEERPAEKIKLEKIDYKHEDVKFVDSLIKSNKNLIVLHVGNGPNAPEKRWPTERFVELAERLHKKGIKIGIIGSKQDFAEVEAFKNAFSRGYLDLFNKLSIPQLAYFLTKASAYLSADTGPAHLAAAMEVPSVVLYGPSNPVEYGAWGGNVHHIYKRLWCSPCGSKINSNQYLCINKVYQKCMLDISVDEVEKKILEVMR